MCEPFSNCFVCRYAVAPPGDNFIIFIIDDNAIDTKQQTEANEQ